MQFLLQRKLFYNINFTFIGVALLSHPYDSTKTVAITERKEDEKNKFVNNKVTTNRVLNEFQTRKLDALLPSKPK